MSHTVKEAKNNLSVLIRLAEKGEPQVISRNGQDVAVVVSIADWQKACGRKQSLVEFLEASPLDEVLEFMERTDDDVREVQLG